MTPAICTLLGILIGADIIIGLRIHNLEHTIYVQMNDLFRYMDNQTKAVERLTETLQEKTNAPD